MKKHRIFKYFLYLLILVGTEKVRSKMDECQHWRQTFHGISKGEGAASVQKL
jgi:hypothetical protein